MDLNSLLSERSYSNNSSAGTESLINQDERDKHKELAVFYNQVIRIKNIKDKKPLKKYHAQNDSNYYCNRSHACPPAARNTKKLVINNDHDDKHICTSKKLMMKNIDDSIIYFTKSNDSNISNHVSCTQNIPRVEIESKLIHMNNIKATNSHQYMSTKQILDSTYAEKATYCRPVSEINAAYHKPVLIKPNNIHQSINTSQTVLIKPNNIHQSINTSQGVLIKTNNIDQSMNTSQTTAPKYAEKTTYCRPVLEMYNQAFIQKTMERNARLQGLVRRLVIARERENEKVARNNYVNELKNRYEYNNSEPRTIPNYEYTPEDMNPDVINYYNSRFSWDQSAPCQNLLEDFYSTSNEIYPHNYKNSNRTTRMPYYYADNKYCPTSPQGQFMMMNRQKSKYQLPHFSNVRSENMSRYLRRNTIVVDKDTNYQPTSKRDFKRSQSNKLLDMKKNNVIKSLSIKRDLKTFNSTTDNEQSREESIKDKYNRVSSNVERLKQKIMQSEKEVNFGSLTSIENKLDVLIDSVNTLIDQIKSKRLTDTKCEAVSCQLSAASRTKTNTFGLMREEQIFCGMVQKEQRSTPVFNEENYHNAIDEILNEEASQSDRVKRDIEEILNKSCVQLTFDIPTKERATEITDSLFKTRISKGMVVEEINGGDTRQMTIAVNTDPLGLLALFRVSAETVKQILSYMPQIDYHSYLSRLQFPQMARDGASHYICNLCGAAFGRPSQLSDHIQQHNLGNSRDCCVCRHALDMPRHRSGLFPCRHCGLQFTRAYCRQLHEQSCGHATSLRNDSPSFMLPR